MKGFKVQHRPGKLFVHGEVAIHISNFTVGKASEQKILGAFEVGHRGNSQKGLKLLAFHCSARVIWGER